MDKNTFTQNIIDCEQTLYRVSMSILRNEQDCEDAVQDTILAAFSKLSTLKNEEFFKTWIVRILINNCNKRLKERKKNISSDTVLEPSAPSDEKSVEVRAAIDTLPTKIRVVVIMYYIEGFSVKEIKDVLKVPEGTVKSRLSRGRSQLSKELCEK